MLGRVLRGTRPSSFIGQVKKGYWKVERGLVDWCAEKSIIKLPQFSFSL